MIFNQIQRHMLQNERNSLTGSLLALQIAIWKFNREMKKMLRRKIGLLNKNY